MAKHKSKPLITKQRESKSSPHKVAGGVSKKKGKKKKAKISHSNSCLPSIGSQTNEITLKDKSAINGQNSSVTNGDAVIVPIHGKTTPVTAVKNVKKPKAKTEESQEQRQYKIYSKHTKSDSNNIKISQTNINTSGANVKVKPTGQLIREDMPVKSASDNTQSALANTNSQDSTGKHRKRSKASKKKQSGSSNWMKLCSTLNIPTERKVKPVKRPMEETVQKAVEADPKTTKRSKPEVWFDNVDKILIETDGDVEKSEDETGNVSHSNQDSSNALVKPGSFKGVTNCVAMDCEMVGIGSTAEESMLARVSLVNHFGVCLYDKFVKPQEKVTDYRTFVSGVTEENLAEGEDFSKVQKEVSDILKGRILVGHAVHHDLKVLFLTHPHKMIRDTSAYQPFRALFNGRKPSLKKLTDKVLGVKVQEGQHSSVQDAQATMRLYTMYRQRWEKELKGKRKKQETGSMKQE